MDFENDGFGQGEFRFGEDGFFDSVPPIVRRHAQHFAYSAKALLGKYLFTWIITIYFLSLSISFLLLFRPLMIYVDHFQSKN